MIPNRLETNPSLANLTKFRKYGSKTIYIKSPIMRGWAELLIESVWRVGYSDSSIRFLNANLISRFEKIPLTPFEIPDRHLRSARRIGAALFGVKRFDRLVLFEMTDPSTGYAVTRDDEARVFTTRVDAKLHTIQREGGGEIGTKTLTKYTARNAQRNSAGIRVKMLRLMTQAMTGVGAIERIKTLKKRGADPKELEKIWCDTHDRNDIPAVLRSILYE